MNHFGFDEPLRLCQCILDAHIDTKCPLYVTTYLHRLTTVRLFHPLAPPVPPVLPPQLWCGSSYRAITITDPSEVVSGASLKKYLKIREQRSHYVS